MRRALLAVAGLVLCCAAVAAENEAAPSYPAGTFEKITVPGPSLEGNLMGDASARTVYVYLPPSYEKSRRQRFPVVYFLQGYGLATEGYVTAMRWPEALDRAMAAPGAREVIVVMPDGINAYGGAMYSNSITTGDWESFVARDLVGYIDKNYRTLDGRLYRGLSGHSMGGYGTLRIGMKNPDVFSSLYAMSACCLDPRGVAPGDADLEKLSSRADVEKLQTLGRTTLAASAAWAPNATKPPFFMDLPTKDGQPQPAVIAQYAANAPVAMASQYTSQLKRYRAIAMDIGLQDFLLPGNLQMHETLQRLGITHTYETYEGDHVNKVAERFEKNVLPFFSKQLQ